MNAAAEAPLTARILGAIARSTSKHPANAADVLAQVGGEEADFWSAIATLIHGRAIASAHIQRQRPVADPAPWLAIWPTGVNLDSGAWRSDTQSARFSSTRSDLGISRKRTARNARTEPASKPDEETNMPAASTITKTERTTSKAQDRRDRVASAIAGCSRANAIELLKIAEAVGLTPEGASYIIKRLEEKGVAQRFNVGKGTKRRCWVFDPRTTTDSAPNPATGGVVPAAEDGGEPMLYGQASPAHVVMDELDRFVHQIKQKQPPVDGIEVHEQIAGDGGGATDNTPDVRIALWDDGSISFVDGENVTQFDRSVVERLALLLGVPRNTAPAQAMTPFPVLNS